MTIVYLVRHAVHDLLGKVLVGRTPGVWLSQEGLAQAALLRDHFAPQPLARILSSTVDRACETAAILAKSQPCAVEQADALDELDCGEWTGATFTALDADPRWHRWNAERANAAIPGGETMRSVQRRTAALIDGLADAQESPIALVTHSDVIKAIVATLIAMPLNLHDRLTIDPASITTIELWGAGAGRIVRLNEVVGP